MRKYLFAGIAALFPLFLTLYIVLFLLAFADNLAGRYINPFLVRTIGFPIPGLGFITLLLFIILTGYLSTRFFGKAFFGWLDRLFLRTPLVAKIYPSIKQLSEFLFTFKKENLQKVAYIEFPYPGAYSLVFVIREGMVLGGMTGMVNVFIPFAPTPLSGLVILVPAEKVFVVDVPVEEAIKYFFSAGVVSPDVFPLKRAS